MTLRAAADPRDRWHWLRHRWGPWRLGRQTYTEADHSTWEITAERVMLGPGATRTRHRMVQYRRCLTCRQIATTPL